VYGVRFSPDSKRLGVGSGDGKLRIWSAADGKLESELPQPQTVTGVAWSPDGRFVACSTFQRVSVYQSNGTKQTDLIPLGLTEGLAVSPEGHLRTGRTDQLIYVLQTATGQVMVNAQEMQTRWGWKNNPRAAQAGE
jgi:WD40 repeat protein